MELALGDSKAVVAKTHFNECEYRGTSRVCIDQTILAAWYVCF